MDYSIETIQIVDIRVITFNIDYQEVMTEDNVACSIAAEKNSTILFHFLRKYYQLKKRSLNSY